MGGEGQYVGLQWQSLAKGAPAEGAATSASADRGEGIAWPFLGSFL